MFVSNSGSRLRPAICLRLGRQMLSESGAPCRTELGPSPPEAASWRRASNEPGVLQELDEDLVDELVLRDGLDHEHPLLPEEPQHRRHFHHLQGDRKGIEAETGCLS